MSDAASNPPVIEMIDVAIASLHRQDVVEVEGVQWEIAPGDFWAVAGTHGSGKSDLLMTAAGLQRALRGTVRLFGRDILQLDEAALVSERLRIGLQFAGGGRLFHNLTVWENVSLPMRYHAKRSGSSDVLRDTERLLGFLGLSEFMHSTPGAMNPAWQRRAALARALALRPEVLLLDEPLKGLDAQHRRWWLDFLRQLADGHEWFDQRAVTLVATTDDLHSLLDEARQFAILRNTRWQVIGGRTEVLAGKELVGDVWASED